MALVLKTYDVLIIDDSQAQDREDCSFLKRVQAYDVQEAESLALREEPVNCYVSGFSEVQP